MDDGEICRHPPPDGVVDPGRVGGGLLPSDQSCAQVAGSSTAIESSSSVWTDEKHSMYLNSIEESFVKELYSREAHSCGSHRWFLGNDRVLNTSKSNSMNPCSDQFKVQRKGCWEELKFERHRLTARTAHEPYELSANAWIRDFRFLLAGSWRQDKSDDRVTSSLKHVPSYKDTCKLEYVISCTEVSDQNFVNEEELEEDNRVTKACRKKRMRNVVADASTNDQVDKRVTKACRKRMRNVVADASTNDQVVPHRKLSIISPLEQEFSEKKWSRFW